MGHRNRHSPAVRAAAVSLLTAGVLVLSGCAGDRVPPDLEARVAADTLCEDLGGLRMDAGELSDLSPATAGIDDIRDLREDVSHALDVVTRSAERVRKAKAGAISDAYDDLSRAIDGLPRDTTGASATERLRPQLEALDQAIAASQAAVKC
ncbi:hypothetical protein [Streptomyces sp. NPDC006368]|uniref:hypothetical protein n=1 Tax=Streptomyces sp. NPDC006368 TaxID=3156760 RepID=UPI0033A8C2B7